MKALARIILCVLAVTASCLVHAEQTKIRVLGLVSPDANVSVATSSLTNLKKTWKNSKNPDGITIVTVNSGVPVRVSIGGTGDILDQSNVAHKSDELLQLRHEYKADIVILFSGVSSYPCGHASQLHWIRETVAAAPPAFVHISNGLDLRARDKSFIANVGTKGTCSNTQIAAHESGHLLGGGHVDIPPFVTFDP